MKIGILGAGQLARMLTLAAYPLGIQTLCFDSSPLSPRTRCGESASAGAMTEVIISPYTDKQQLQNFAEQVDLITYETENIPLETVQFLSQYRSVFPSPQALAVAQDRLQEKTLFRELNIATTRFMAIESLPDLYQAAETLGFPCVLKTRFFGYDGKGQQVLKTAEDIERAWQLLGEQPLLLEEFINFDSEVSLIGVRSEQDTRFYPLTQNTHHAGILRLSIAPYENEQLRNLAESYTQRILKHLDYRGVLAIEFFCVGEQLIANEIAPRVHNSGHWTIEGASCSQFENHLRAITGLPLGSTEAGGYSAMFNCISTEPDLQKILSVPHVHYHHYAKAPMPGRKLAHFTLSTPELLLFEQHLAELQALMKKSRRGLQDDIG